MTKSPNQMQRLPLLWEFVVMLEQQAVETEAQISQGFSGYATRSVSTNCLQSFGFLSPVERITREQMTNSHTEA
jgi:hypothetical protein